jgi:hypothetical protein
MKDLIFSMATWNITLWPPGCGKTLLAAAAAAEMMDIL